MRNKLSIWLPAAVATLLIVSIVGYQIDGVQWRASVLRHKASGDLQGVSWSELLAMLQPGSGIYLRDMAKTPNPYAVIRNPFDSARDYEEGERLYTSQCMHCHGAAGIGGVAPNIVSERLSHGDSDWAVFRTIKDGVDGTAMAPANLTDEDRWRVTGYLLRLRQLDDGGGQEVAASLPQISVPFERIVNADSEPHNWLTYSGGYDGQRHSSLNGINIATLERLRLQWVLQTDSKDAIEGSPIIVDGVMYLSLAESAVMAIDAKTGEEYWRWRPEMKGNLSICCGRVNRGVAVLEDKVYVATLDNRLQCLDAASGKLLWEQEVARSEDGFTITVAPLAVKDKIIVGVSGGEFGVRGFLDAYNAASGVREWRFYTVPEPGQPGHETWSGESWRTGGGPTWVTGSYDPGLNLLYWGVGNPAPDFDGSVRIGDNLYTNSVIALDVDSGELQWFFQFTPHDLHDYDSNQVPVLVDQSFNGQDRSLMLWANRNGFFYVLDRSTGNYLGSVPFAKQSWAIRIDEFGKPTRNPDSIPSRKGTIVWPGSSGATNWPPPSFSPASGLFYVGRSDRASIYFNHETTEPREPGETWLGSAATYVPGSSITSVVAIDPQTIEIAWEKRLPDVDGRAHFSGVLTTSELVFVGAGEIIFALDSLSGEVLWSTRLGGAVGSPPTIYAIDNTQYLTLAAGKNVYAFGVEISEQEWQTVD